MCDESLRAGIVLAGGFSVRFGTEDKAVADLGGEPMIARVARRVDAVTDELLLNCREEQAGRIEEVLASSGLAYRFAFDSTPDQGPLAGILAGLEATNAPYVAVLACDTPFAEPSLLEHLFERASGRDGAVPDLETRGLQPTVAVYRSDAMATACRNALDADRRSIKAALENIDWVAVDEADVLDHAALETFETVESKTDLERARRRLSNE